MTTTLVYNETQLKAWDGNSNLDIAASFTISTNVGFPLTINGSYTINGCGNTITISSLITDWYGMFSIPEDSDSNITIKKFFVNYAGNTRITSISGTFVSSLEDRTNNFSFNIFLCSITATTTVTIHPGCGSIIGQGFKGTINNCSATNLILEVNSGGISGSYATNLGQITNCFTSYTTADSYCGGIVGYYSSCKIIGCYSVGRILNSSCGGIAGDVFSGQIYNCYTTGTFQSGNNSGGIVASYLQSDAIIKNCYSSMIFLSSNNGGIAGGDAEGGTIENCYSLNSTSDGVGTQELIYSISGVGPTINDCAFGSETWSSTFAGTKLFNDITIDSVLYSNVWTGPSPTFTTPPPDGTSNYLLYGFTQYPWNHTTYDSILSLTLPITCIVKGAKVMCRKGYIPIEQLTNQDELKCLDGTRTVWKKIFKIKCNSLDISDLNNWSHFRQFSPGVTDLINPSETFYLTWSHALLFNEQIDLKPYVNDDYYKDQEQYDIRYKIKGLKKLFASHANFGIIPDPQHLIEQHESKYIKFYHICLRDTNRHKQYGILVNNVWIESCDLENFQKT